MRHGLIALISGLVLFSLLCSSAAAEEGSSNSAGWKRANGFATYVDIPGASKVGGDTCTACHEDTAKNFQHAFHKQQGVECEDCHGNGSLHVEGGGDVSKIFVFGKDHSTKEMNERCLACHRSDNEQFKAINSVHAANDVSCTSCHSPHHAEMKEFLLQKPQPELCYSCHLQQKAQFDMPFHHRVNEGLIQCSDCHNPHGAIKPKQVRASATQDAVCFKCHMDKQGPFVYEHAPVKIDGCQSCHQVHGGPNPYMLRVSNLNLLCLQCHTTSSFSSAPGAPSFHNQASFFQSCVLCHSQVHGSNFDATFFK